MIAMPAGSTSHTMRTFYAVLANSLTASLTNTSVWFAITFWVFLQTKSVIATSVMAGVYTITVAATGFFLGSLVDRYKKNVMLFSSIGSLCLYTLAFVIFIATPTEIFTNAAIKQSGWYPELIVGFTQMGAGFAETMKPTPIYQLYASVAPKPENWVSLCGKMGELTRKDFDLSRQIAAFKMPVLIVMGDADGVRPGHAVEIFALLGGGKIDGSWDGSGMSNSRLAILPATTHYNIFSSPTLVASVLPFLDAPMPE